MLRIALVDDDPITARIVSESLRTAMECEVVHSSSGEDFLRDHFPGLEFDIVLLDIIMPGMSGLEVLSHMQANTPVVPPVIILSAQDKVDTAVKALQSGARDYFMKPIDLVRLEHSIRTIAEVRTLKAEVEQLRHQIQKEVLYNEIIASSGEMRDVFNFITKVKDANVPVLILGESGTGKELVARAIHYNGNRAAKPFVAVNCAAIPNDLLESELFGHERGAFTGAVGRKVGKFEMANGGTLFLDEVAELDVNLQSKLLRVLQAKVVERVGGKESIPIDVRIISATNANLADDTTSKRFRTDLYYRLSTFPIILPPLRKRRSDIVILADHFLKKYASEYGKPGVRLDRNVLRIFNDYNWPGNVRELENIIQRAIIMCEETVIREKDIPNLTPAPMASAGALEPFFDSLEVLPSLDELNLILIRQMLKRERGKISAVAKKLNIGRATLYRMIKKHQLTDVS